MAKRDKKKNKKKNNKKDKDKPKHSQTNNRSEGAIQDGIDNVNNQTTCLTNEYDEKTLGVVALTVPLTPNLVTTAGPLTTETAMITTHASTVTNHGASSSWGAAFAAAASIQPEEGLEEEDDDDNADVFESCCDGAKGGIASVSMLALEEQKRQTERNLSLPTLEQQRSKSKLVSQSGNEGSDDDDDNNDDANLRHVTKKRKTTSSAFSSAEHDSDDEILKGKKDTKVNVDENLDETNSPTLEGQMITNHNGESIMVLIDRRKGVVYSCLEQTPDGNRLVVGNFEDGMVHLFQNDEVTAKADGTDSTPEDHARFPYPTDPDDHCESPPDAYEDILPLLRKLATTIQRNQGSSSSNNQHEPSDHDSTDVAQLAIYDPYYCDGSVIANLSKLGFPNVYNKKEDCYKIWSDEKLYPKYDAFVTNPPYSGDHIERLMQHVTSNVVGNRPWFLLMPNWVHKKDYFTRCLTREDKSTCQPFYLVPRKRYTYIPPKNFREKKVSDVHKKSSPFVSMWYIWGGTTEINDLFIKTFQKEFGNTKCEMARSKSALRDLRRKRTNKKRKKR